MTQAPLTQTPMMQQYRQAKAACPEALLLFRMGDFYELFFDDAKTAARAVNLTLTSREKGEQAIPMAGFPHHQLESYLGKLIRLGFRVAICDQVENPKDAKGLVRREVTRVVTPGTLTDDGLLDPRASNYLAALVPGDPAGLAWVEISTGLFEAGVVAADRVADELARISPTECLVPDEPNGDPPRTAHLGGPMSLTRRPNWAFAATAARDMLTKHFQTHHLDGFGFDDGDVPAIRAAGAILEYLAETQKTSLDHIDRLVRYRTGTTLELDEATRRSLEISCTLRDGRREGSLLAVLDRCVTAMGSRRLAQWVASPLVDVGEIDERLDAVGELVAEANLADQLHEILRPVYDLERLVARATTGRATPRDLSFIGRTLRGLPTVKAKLTGRKTRLLVALENEIDLCPELRSQLDSALVDDCPLASSDGGFIRDGYSPELDQLRELARGGKQWIARYQAQEIETSGIPSLKVGYNKVFGYYLEVTNVHREKIPAHYIRKQTIKNSERYITPELKEYEEKVLSADEKAKELEQSLFLRLRETTTATARRLVATARALAQVDALAGLAKLARDRKYCRPRVVDDPVLNIVEGRHPVLDIIEPEGTFVPNDTVMGESVGHALRAEGNSQSADPAEMRHAERALPTTILLITGPNMAGKSTYIRQVALLTMMAQIGSFVPARAATIGVADRIFARVGASDELSRGQSTFMVEMTETARILNTATPQSLVILDEIGRGTSTYDGLALAWAVVEHLHERIGCRTLFATHYHELTDLERSLPGVRNLNVAVREWQDDVIFLHQIVPGAADKSYGIHVARLAGVPREVNQRAKEILSQLEARHVAADGEAKLARRGRRQRAGRMQMTLFEPDVHPVVEQIRRIDLDQTTPIQALHVLKQLQSEVGQGQAESG
jgi:DNA mismatch repair protein MutS